ncbi:MAG: RpoL/Rpb11 RNA polymerase subunit family protein [archaeon]
MQINVVKNEKDTLELEIDNLTVVEAIRTELWSDEKVEIAAWKREHPTKNPVLVIKVKEGTAKRALNDSIARLQKTNDSLLEKFKAAMK